MKRWWLTIIPLALVVAFLAFYIYSYERLRTAVREMIMRNDALAQRFEPRARKEVLSGWVFECQEPNSSTFLGLPSCRKEEHLFRCESKFSPVGLYGVLKTPVCHYMASSVMNAQKCPEGLIPLVNTTDDSFTLLSFRENQRAAFRFYWKSILLTERMDSNVVQRSNRLEFVCADGSCAHLITSSGCLISFYWLRSNRTDVQWFLDHLILRGCDRETSSEEWAPAQAAVEENWARFLRLNW